MTVPFKENGKTYKVKRFPASTAMNINAASCWGCWMRSMMASPGQHLVGPPHPCLPPLWRWDDGHRGSVACAHPPAACAPPPPTCVLPALLLVPPLFPACLCPRASSHPDRPCPQAVSTAPGTLRQVMETGAASSSAHLCAQSGGKARARRDGWRPWDDDRGPRDCGWGPQGAEHGAGCLTAHSSQQPAPAAGAKPDWI